MKTTSPLHTILFSSLLALSATAAAQNTSASGSANGSGNASADTSGHASANASVNASLNGRVNGSPTGPADQLAIRYAELAGSTEAAAELVQQLRVDADTGATMISQPR